MNLSVFAALAAGLGALGISSDAALAQDAAIGQKVFTYCQACHRIGPGAINLIGPQLNGIIGRHSASVPNFNYTQQLKDSGIVWDAATLTTWVHNPMAMVPGTRMTFPGLTNDMEVGHLITFLSQYGPEGEMKPGM